MKALSHAQKVDALKNALSSNNFPKKYSVHPLNYHVDRFAICSVTESGARHTHSRFMTYDEFNAYLMGYNAAKKNKF